MEIDFFWLAIGIAIAGYCIGDGLKNFKNPQSKDLLDMMENDDEPELIPEKNVHHYIGISKDDVESLIEEYPEIPHLSINGNVYYPKGKLRKWLEELGE
jgi:hypothetical protein